MAIVCLALASLLGSGCTSNLRSPSSLTADAKDDLEGLILLLADRKIYDSYTVTSALTEGPGVRARLADALGRTGSERALGPLVALLTDTDSNVRQRAVFALGVLGDDRAADALRAVASAEDSGHGRLAVEALAKVGRPLGSVVGDLAQLPEEEMWRRLAPSLYRFDPKAILETAAKGFGVSDPEVRGGLIYALARDPIPEGLPILRTFRQDEDPRVRAWTARALGLVGEEEDVEWLLEAMDDTDAVAIQAVAALRQLADRESATPRVDWIAPWLAMTERERPGPRAAALGAAAAWPESEALDDRLYELAAEGTLRDFDLALSALGKRWSDRDEALPARLESLLQQGVEHENAGARATAARTAALLGRSRLVERLAFDDAPGVRMAVHETLLSGAPDEAAAAAVWILRDPDAVVRAATLEWLGEQPRLPAEVLIRALEGFSVNAPGEMVVALVRALTARASTEPTERGWAMGILEEIGKSTRYVVRRAVFEALTELGGEPARPEPAGGTRHPDFYSAVVGQKGELRVVEFETERGAFQVEVDCPSAPITCVSFLQLVRQGFYDGLSFHRVVPDFVVQTGDPRGDGWGGPGFDLRAEITPIRYGRGVLGMADSGLDTAGSQIFLTLAPQPHLDGRYTAFGRTISGDAVLDRIEQGDAILSVREVEP